VLAETDNAGNISNYYVYGLGLLSKITAAGQRYTYHYDTLGSTVAVTDNSDTITEKYAYDEFGKALGVSETTPNPFRYVGQYGVLDEGNGYLFMRARYYDAGAGKFVSKDPLGFGGGDFNLYGYVGGNPLVGIDPSGLLPSWPKVKFVWEAGKVVVAVTKSAARIVNRKEEPPLPTYGNYGGPSWTGGKYKGDFSAPSLDAMDELFRHHDLTYRSNDASIRHHADEILLSGLKALDQQCWDPYTNSTDLGSVEVYRQTAITTFEVKITAYDIAEAAKKNATAKYSTFGPPM
jgi:RHS repeat-associated protein